MKRARKIITTSFCLFLSTVVGCEQSSSTGPQFAFVINVPGRFWDIAHAGCQRAAREVGAEVVFQVPGDSTAAQQKQIVEDLMSKGIDGLAISPLSPDSIARLLDQAGERFPVICQDSDAPNSRRMCYIGTDNVAFGRKQGELLKEALPDGGQIAIFVGKMDVANARERHQGVVEALEGSNITVVETFTDNASRPRARSNVLDALIKYPDLKGVVGLWGYNAPQAVNAMKDHIDRELVIVGADEDIETFQAVRDGKMYASVAQRPFEFGYQSIKLLMKLHRGESVEIPEDKMIFVPTYVIKPDNASELEQEIEGYLKELK